MINHIMSITIINAWLHIQINYTIIYTDNFSLVFKRIRKIAKYDY